MVIARHFSAGNRRENLPSPGGTAEIISDSAVPPGLVRRPVRFPALKCRAITTTSLRDAPSFPALAARPRNIERGRAAHAPGKYVARIRIHRGKGVTPVIEAPRITGETPAPRLLNQVIP